MIGFTDITSYKASFRFYGRGFVYDVSGPAMFNSENDISNNYLLGLLNSKICDEVMLVLSPTIHMNQTALSKVSIIHTNIANVEKLSQQCITISKSDWDSFETSWDFKRHPLLDYMEEAEREIPVVRYNENGTYSDSDIEIYVSVENAFLKWQAVCEERFQQLKANEEELNRIFIDIYGLQEELTPEVEEKDVTVRRAELGRDIRSLLSYAVGCMFGRYSLDVEGLAYAGGEWDKSKYTTFQPDTDNIVPLTDGAYLEEDIVSRLCQWLQVVYGPDTLEENLDFIAKALGNKGATARESIRIYFLKDFFADHCKIYQKRPIYWMFDSGKKNGFKCLIYMHRYQPDTIARIRTDYVHEQQSRYRTAIADLEKRMENAATGERVKLSKQLKKLQEQAEEIRVYEEEIHHLADQMISIDLDDGVKVNYAKFQDVLAKIK